MNTKIKLSTDSTSDISKEYQEKYNITVIPLTILAGDTEYRDGVDITTEEFYPMLASTEKLPVSSALIPYTYECFFEEMYAEGYTDLIHVSINSKGSSTYQNGVMARETFYQNHPEAKDTFRIHIIDSLNYSMGYGLAVLKGAEMAQNGASVEEIIAWITDWLAHARVLVVTLDLKIVKKSGRISPAAAFVGDAIGVKPVITFTKGESEIINKVRGERAAINKLTEYCKNERKPGTPYVIAKAGNDSVFEGFRTNLEAEIPEAPEFAFNLGCIITINTGPNAIGIVYYKKD